MDGMILWFLVGIIHCAWGKCKHSNAWYELMHLDVVTTSMVS